MTFRVHRTEFSLRAGGSDYPLIHRANRAPLESTTTVGADVVQNVIYALRAERAFKGTNPRLRRIGRKIDITVFATWS